MLNDFGNIKIIKTTGVSPYEGPGILAETFGEMDHKIAILASI